MLLGCLGLAGAIAVAQAPASGGRGELGAVPPSASRAAAGWATRDTATSTAAI